MSYTEPCFEMRLPPLSKRRVWAGVYTDMTGTIQPFFDAGLMEANESGIPVASSSDLQAHTVIPIELIACWDDENRLIGLNMRADN